MVRNLRVARVCTWVIFVLFVGSLIVNVVAYPQIQPEHRSSYFVNLVLTVAITVVSAVALWAMQEDEPQDSTDGHEDSAS